MDFYREEILEHWQNPQNFGEMKKPDVVIEQVNLTPSVLLSEINRLMGDQALREKMSAGAKSFAKPEAARSIAEEIINLALAHED